MTKGNDKHGTARGNSAMKKSANTRPSRWAICDRRPLVGGYAAMVQDMVDRGWRAYLVTFMFNRLPGRQAAVVRQMGREVERVYARPVTHDLAGVTCPCSKLRNAGKA